MSVIVELNQMTCYNICMKNKLVKLKSMLRIEKSKASKTNISSNIEKVLPLIIKTAVMNLAS